MSWYTIQGSNHRQAGKRIPTEAASKSWEILYDGQIATAADARQAVDELSNWYRNVRAYKGKSIGKLWYANLRQT